MLMILLVVKMQPSGYSTPDEEVPSVVHLNVNSGTRLRTVGRH